MVRALLGQVDYLATLLPLSHHDFTARTNPADAQLLRRAAPEIAASTELDTPGPCGSERALQGVSLPARVGRQAGVDCRRSHPFPDLRGIARIAFRIRPRRGAVRDREEERGGRADGERPFLRAADRQRGRIPLAAVAGPYPSDRRGDEHFHHEGEEWIYVLTGRLTLSLAGSVYELDAGDAAHFDSQIPHRLIAREGTDVEVLLVASPLRAGAKAEQPRIREWSATPRTRALARPSNAPPRGRKRTTPPAGKPISATNTENQ